MSLWLLPALRQSSQLADISSSVRPKSAQTASQTPTLISSNIAHKEPCQVVMPSSPDVSWTSSKTNVQKGGGKVDLCCRNHKDLPGLNLLQSTSNCLVNFVSLSGRLKDSNQPTLPELSISSRRQHYLPWLTQHLYVEKLNAAMTIKCIPFCS